jgi:lysyl-tRNA synthetase class 2
LSDGRSSEGGWSEGGSPGELRARWPSIAGRSRVVRAVREFFHDRDFVEVETPGVVPCPGLEPHLVALRAAGDAWLRTSPELHMKRLLAAGAERIFQIGPCWRGDEQGPWHLREFSMLEWYRAHAGLDAIAEDVAQLLPRAVEAGGRDPSDVRGCDLTAAPERIGVREAVQRATGLDLATVRERDALAGALGQLGIGCDADDGWDDLFFRLFLERVEAGLGRDRVTILDGYPASQAALANVRDDPEWPVALRFEVYVAGIELANAFDELTDPAEQRRRHEADRATRRAAGREVPDLDEDFLAALAEGMPPSAGIALGIDRLVALALGADDARGAVAFPTGAS